MSAVIGMSDLLMDTPLTPEQQELTGVIHSSSEALLALINDILDFSKIEAGQIELEQRSFDLRDCLESSLDLMVPKVAEKKLELVYLLGPNIPTQVLGDITRLRQILVNLLSNAVKFTEQGEVAVSVTAHPLVVPDVTPNTASQSLPPHYQFQFAVRDTGIGIPPEKSDRLFKTFSQADVSTTREYGGTGLGLVISKRLSELMGGTLWVDSEVHQGSTFYFTIVAPAIDSVSQLDHQTLQGKRVLIVDSNLSSQTALVLQTQTWAMYPHATQSAVEALDWVQQGQPCEVVILNRSLLDHPEADPETDPEADPEADPETDPEQQNDSGGPSSLPLETAPQALPHTNNAVQSLQQACQMSKIPLVLLTPIETLGPEVPGFDSTVSKPIKHAPLHGALVQVLTPMVPSHDTNTITHTIKDKNANPTRKTGLAPQSGGRKSLRILLAEDNPVNQKVALKVLQKIGHTADVVANGLDAIQALKDDQSYDVILMDMQMPEMDGLAATRHICQHWPREQRPQIIAMTANATQDDQRRCLEAGMDGYLSKPVRLQALTQVLDRC